MHPVEWLSDNGSAYIAKDTLDTATALGLKLCFTPVRSPESNGIAEAFVKTFKRDYARLSILPDAETVSKRPVKLSITHNSCADRGAQPDIGETGQAAPHHDVPRRRIIGAREVSA